MHTFTSYLFFLPIFVYLFLFFLVHFTFVPLNVSCKVTQGTGHYHYPCSIQAIHLPRRFWHYIGHQFSWNDVGVLGKYIFQTL